MEDLKDIKNKIVEDFSMYEEWLDKYEYIIELGKNLDGFPQEYKTEENLIKGCQSRVWLRTEMRGGLMFFTADSDAIITKGIISLLISVYSGRSASEIVNDDFKWIESIGLKENLSPTRAGGLVAMINRIKAEAQKEL